MDPSLAEAIRRLSHLRKLVLHHLSQRFSTLRTIDPGAQEAERKFLELLAADTYETSLCEVSLRTGWTWRRDNGGTWICQSN